MTIEDATTHFVSEPEICDRKKTMASPAAESFHFPQTPVDSSIYRQMRPSHQHNISQAVGNFSAQQCHLSSNDFLPGSQGNTDSSQQSRFLPNNLYATVNNEKSWPRDYAASSYCSRCPTFMCRHSPYQRSSHQSVTVDPTPRNCKATIRESTSILKEWIENHKKNPYPTKGEKISLAIKTKMTLTQVSTWFANARRRLKKENKMTWHPKNKTSEIQSQSQEKNSLEEDISSDQKLNIETGSIDTDGRHLSRFGLDTTQTSQDLSMFSAYRQSSISKPEMLLDSNTYPTSSFNDYGNTYHLETAAAHQQTAHIDVYPNKHQGSGIGDYGNNLSFDASVGMRDFHCSRSVPTDNNRLNWPANVNSFSTSNADNELPATMRHYHNVVNDRGYMANSCEAYQVDYHHQRKPNQLMQYKQFNPTFKTPAEAPLLPMSAPKYFQNVQPNIANFQSTEYRIQPDQLFNNQSATNISSPFQPELESNSQVHVSSLIGDNEHSMIELLQANPIPPLSNAPLSPSDSSSSIFQYNNSSANAATSTETSSVSYASSCVESSYSPLSQTFSPSYNPNFNSEFASNSTVLGQKSSNNLMMMS